MCVRLLLLRLLLLLPTLLRRPWSSSTNTTRRTFFLVFAGACVRACLPSLSVYFSPCSSLLPLIVVSAQVPMPAPLPRARAATREGMDAEDVLALPALPICVSHTPDLACLKPGANAPVYSVLGLGPPGLATSGSG